MSLVAKLAADRQRLVLFGFGINPLQRRHAINPALENDDHLFAQSEEVS